MVEMMVRYSSFRKFPNGVSSGSQPRGSVQLPVWEGSSGKLVAGPVLPSWIPGFRAGSGSVDNSIEGSGG